jgi:hypothetical protein
LRRLHAVTARRREPQPGCWRSSPTAASIVLHPGLSEASGDEALALLQAAAAGRLPFDILCVEGALLRGPNGSGRFPDALRQRPAGDRLGPRTGRPRAARPRHRHLQRLRRHHLRRRKRHRRLRSAVRRRPGRRPARQGFPCGFRPAGDQRRRLPDASGLGRRHPALAGLGALGESDLDAWQRPRSTPSNWSITAARATSSTNSRPAPRSSPTSAA